MASFIPPPVAADGTTIASLNGVLSALSLPAVAGNGPGASAGSTVNYSLSGVNSGGQTSDDSFGSWIAPRAGTLSNFLAQNGAALTAGNTMTLTVLKNGVATAITVTWANGAAAKTTVQDTTHTVSVAAGDRIQVQDVATAGLGASMHPCWSVVFS